MISYAGTTAFCFFAAAFPLISLMDYEQGNKKKREGEALELVDFLQRGSGTQTAER